MVAAVVHTELVVVVTYLTLSIPSSTLWGWEDVAVFQKIRK